MKYCALTSSQRTNEDAMLKVGMELQWVQLIIKYCVIIIILMSKVMCVCSSHVGSSHGRVWGAGREEIYTNTGDSYASAQGRDDGESYEEAQGEDDDLRMALCVPSGSWEIHVNTFIQLTGDSSVHVKEPHNRLL